jgi:hypothetical protein
LDEPKSAPVILSPRAPEEAKIEPTPSGPTPAIKILSPDEVLQRKVDRQK